MPIEVILHGTTSGPDYHRLASILALKTVPWKRPTGFPKALDAHLNPNSDLPVMQYGQCFFEGSMIATLALEQLLPEHSLFPNGNNGMPLALVWWSDAFYNDISSSKGSALLRPHCTLIARQLSDGREYLQGAEPGLADVHSFAPLKAIQADGYSIDEALKAFPILQEWYQRMDDLLSMHLQANRPNPPPEHFPECDSIAEKVILEDGQGMLWRSCLL